MTVIPTLETTNLNLIPPSMEAYDLYEQFYSDAAASSMYGGPIEAEQIWARLKADVGSWYLLGFGVWVIQMKSSGRLVGVCGFWQGKNWPKELTWWVLPDYRGKGVASESSRAAVQYAYRSFKWDAVHTYMNDDNVAASALVKKLGGIKVHRQQFVDGVSRDVFKIPVTSGD